MWGTYCLKTKLPGDLGNVIGAILIRWSLVGFFKSKKISARQFGTFSTASTPSGRSAVDFAVLHNGPHDVVAYGPRPIGGFGETASNYEP
jgi:hypothetical protein